MIDIAGLTVKVALEADKVQAHARRKRDRALFKIGGYSSRAMQRIQRYANKKGEPSKPGEPPRAHRDTPGGPQLRKLTGFIVDRRAGSVSIGPKKFGPLSQPEGKPVPQALNEGARVKAKLDDGKTVVAELEARPFTAPVFTDGGKKLAEILEKDPL